MFTLIICILSFLLGILLCHGIVKNDLRDLKKYRSTYLFTGGYSEEFRSYNLMSIDGGENWYAIKYNKTLTPWETIILGPAKEIYPGLLEQRRALDNLCNHAQKYGPIELSNLNQEKTELLNNAGFKLVKTPKE